jgi:hypothetical protein
MCDYSLHAVASRPTKIGETLVSTRFRGTPSRGFASIAEKRVAVCLLPGTELAFEANVKRRSSWFRSKIVGFNVAKFSKIDPETLHKHHDSLEFPDGSTVLVQALVEGQRLKVIQMPATDEGQKSRRLADALRIDPIAR